MKARAIQNSVLYHCLGIDRLFRNQRKMLHIYAFEICPLIDYIEICWTLCWLWAYRFCCTWQDASAVGENLLRILDALGRCPLQS